MLKQSLQARGGTVKLDEVLTTARDAVTVRRVYADPYEKDGITFIAGAAVAGGGGGGHGHDKEQQEGEGAGFGMAARPAGAFVITDGKVEWQPAIDVNRIIGVAGAVVVAYLLSRIPIRTARAARRRRRSTMPMRTERARGHTSRRSRRGLLMRR